MRTFALLALALALIENSAAAEVDTAASKVLVHVEKSGLFAAFAHNHVIAAPLASANLDMQKKTVEVRFRTQDMKVLDPGTRESERAEIEETMKSDKVLDPAQFPEITFASTSAEGTDPKHFVVRGNLSLHGVTKPIELKVSCSEGRCSGKFTLKQTEFGITPVKIAGGAVRVKDPIEIEFDIVTK